MSFTRPRLSGYLSSAAMISASFVLWTMLLSFSYAYAQSLLPLYGSTPTRLHLEHIAFTVVAAAMVTPPLVAEYIGPRRSSGANLVFISGPLLLIAPFTTYWIAVYSSRMKDPVWGPVITHFMVLVPITYLLAVAAINLNVSVFLQNRSKRNHSRKLSE
jgi:hypothetical protein